MKRIDELAFEKGISKSDYAKWYFSEQGCELLEEYQHTMKKMRYKCKCGRESLVCWNKFTQRNRRCGYCASNGRRHRYSLEEVKQQFQDLGCILLEEKYMGCHCPLKYICVCKNVSCISLSALKKGMQCKNCGILKQSGPKHWAWKKDRVKHRQEQLFRKKCYKALRSTLESTNQIKVGRTSDWIGYGPKELQVYITNHPNWSKIKNRKWHLDHIFPIQAFIDNKINDASIINALDNLQPLLGKDNISKGDKYNMNEFKLWLLSKGVVI